MSDERIVSKITEYLHKSTVDLAGWLKKILSRISDNWWQENVIDKLSYNQRIKAQEEHYEKLSEFDLAALLRIADRNWYAMRDITYLPNSERECIRAMQKVRNNWAHVSGELLPKSDIISDLNTIKSFFEQLGADRKTITEIERFIEEIENSNLDDNEAFTKEEAIQETAADNIQLMSMVYLVGEPDSKGIVTAIDKIGDRIKYTVFIDGSQKAFYDGQVLPAIESKKYNWIGLDTLQSYLSAFEINNPSSGNLYSLNSARIDFVPYQFRPALKMIKSDEPRILIADSVGVGKTIEAGLIIKELEARNNLDNVMIICPKPLVSERKWELEMKRFDEDFVPLTGSMFRQIINDTDRDGEWPSRYSKTIVPYSILDGRAYSGDDEKGTCVGLEKLDPKPHFDLVIVDEAHHIRNGSMEKEKAFAYKCVKTMCDNADAVIMLTATPLQTGDDDLFTLLNVLRPDVVMDKDSFTLMSQPNAYISKCASIVRRAEGDKWPIEALEALNGVVGTQWGENVVAKNPVFTSVITRLEQENIDRDERVRLITDIESLHTFNSMLNRTRRKDIQDFCVRRSFTLENDFTARQRELHDELLNFERVALASLHNIRSVPFMISTIRRQAASCIFGLAPHIRDIINRRFTQLNDDPDFDIDEVNIDSKSGASLQKMAAKVLELADNLPDEDTKLDNLIKIINEKQKEDNNKIIIFSTYRYTLRYIKNKIINLGYRVEQIDGSVKDEERLKIRNRFELPKDDANAIDIMMFTEVGSEGLDYQFCNTMINYDLPWNPMRIEQRIGRIDRRGQQSEFVNIYNLITSGTVDADIYNRCLMRIGVFERSIGECEQILGEIGNQVEKIVFNSSLTDDERRKKLEQMADNEVRKVQELNRLEDEEKELFGFDLSSKTMSDEIRNAESPWLSQKNLLSLVNYYLKTRLGDGNYILGEGVLKTLRVSAVSRQKLLEDLAEIKKSPNAIKRKWEQYLKGTVPNHYITFDSDCAKKERNAFFITSVHPLIKQAAAYFAVNAPTYVSIIYDTDLYPKGEYAFSVYAWNYIGNAPRFKLTAVCENDKISDDFIEIIQNGSEGKPAGEDYEAKWHNLEEKHVSLWEKERQANREEAEQKANFKKQSLLNNYNSKKRIIENQIKQITDEHVIRMRKTELENATERYNANVERVNRETEKSDIHTTLIANGVIKIV